MISRVDMSVRDLTRKFPKRANVDYNCKGARAHGVSLLVIAGMEIRVTVQSLVSWFLVAPRPCSTITPGESKVGWVMLLLLRVLGHRRDDRRRVLVIST